MKTKLFYFLFFISIASFCKLRWEYNISQKGHITTKTFDGIGIIPIGVIHAFENHQEEYFGSKSNVIENVKIRIADLSFEGINRNENKLFQYIILSKETQKNIHKLVFEINKDNDYQIIGYKILNKNIQFGVGSATTQKSTQSTSDSIVTQDSQCAKEKQIQLDLESINKFFKNNVITETNIESILLDKSCKNHQDKNFIVKAILNFSNGMINECTQDDKNFFRCLATNGLEPLAQRILTLILTSINDKSQRHIIFCQDSKETYLGFTKMAEKEIYLNPSKAPKENKLLFYENLISHELIHLSGYFHVKDKIRNLDFVDIIDDCCIEARSSNFALSPDKQKLCHNLSTYFNDYQKQELDRSNIQFRDEIENKNFDPYWRPEKQLNKRISSMFAANGDIKLNMTDTLGLQLEDEARTNRLYGFMSEVFNSFKNVFGVKPAFAESNNQDSNNDKIQDHNKSESKTSSKSIEQKKGQISEVLPNSGIKKANTLPEGNYTFDNREEKPRRNAGNMKAGTSQAKAVTPENINPNNDRQQQTGEINNFYPDNRNSSQDERRLSNDLGSGESNQKHRDIYAVMEQHLPLVPEDYKTIENILSGGEKHKLINFLNEKKISLKDLKKTKYGPSDSKFEYNFYYEKHGHRKSIKVIFLEVK